MQSRESSLANGFPTGTTPRPHGIICTWRGKIEWMKWRTKRRTTASKKKTGSMDRKKWCVCGFFSQAVNAITQNSHRRLFARPLIMIIIIILPRQNQKTIFSVNVTEGGWVCVCFSMYLFLFILFFFFIGWRWMVYFRYLYSWHCGNRGKKNT